MARLPSMRMAGSRRFNKLPRVALEAWLVLALAAAPAWGRVRAAGWCQQGGQTVQTSGLTSTTTVQRSYPKCLVTVNLVGGGAATLYSDDLGTSLSNPFTANAEGYWFFYADDGRYDVTLSGAGILTPFTLEDLNMGGVSTLGGLSSPVQTFVNDSNVTITSVGSTHTLGWSGTLAATRGGTGAATLAANGVLLGNGASAIQATLAGAANQILRVPGGGGSPAFGTVNLASASAVTGALPILNGGTSATTQTTAFNALSPLTTKGDLLLHNGANNIRLGVGTNNYSLLADSTQASGVRWGQLSLTTGVTGALPIANGGTGQTTATAAFDALDPLTTKGDLPTHNGTNSVRQGIGTNNYVLMADSTQASGLKWAQVGLATSNVTGTLPLANGGTGLTAGTSGGVLGFTAAGTLTSSVALTANQLVLGGGAGATPVPLGSLGTTTTLLHGNAAGAPTWGAVALTTDISGVLPIANGGTSATTQTAGFDALSPLTTKGDLVSRNGANNVRLGVGSDGSQLTAASGETTGLKWVAPFHQCHKDTVAYTAVEFKAASLTADVTLFTLGQYQKISGLTVKHSVEFSDGGGALTDVSVELGYVGSPDFYAAISSIGEATAVADNAFLDVTGWTSSTMGAAGATVLAHFMATGRNFGDGANTFLTGGSVSIWTCYVSIE